MTVHCRFVVRSEYGFDGNHLGGERASDGRRQSEGPERVSTDGILGLRSRYC